MVYRAVILLLSASLLTACFAEPDVEVSINPNPFWGTLAFDVRAVSDKTTIKKVVINRGGCVLPAGTATDIVNGVRLEFGQKYTGYSNNCSVNDVKEVEVTTDKGEFTFEF